MITSEHKREIAFKLLEGHPGWYPEHSGKEIGLNDSHLCRFRNEAEDVLVSVKCLTRGKTKPCIGIYFLSETKQHHLEDFRNLGQPVGFILNEDAIRSNSSTGWVEFCRVGDCDEDRMYSEIVVSADKREEWKNLFEALRKWGTDNIGVESHYGQEKGWNPKWGNAPLQRESALKKQEKRIGQKFDVKTCRGILSMLQREGAELLGDGVRRPSGKNNKDSLRLCQIGDVLLSLSLKTNQIEAKLSDTTPNRLARFRKLWGQDEDVKKIKMKAEIIWQEQINPGWVKEVTETYQFLLSQLTSGEYPFLYKKIDWRRKQFDPPNGGLQCVDTLEKSLLFAMSHGSHELFHTNVWAWLVKRYPKFARAFFEDIDTDTIVEVRREQGNRDLTIWVEINGLRKAYVIENKFKSTAREEQLVEYRNTLSGEFAGGLLVTLGKLPKWFILPEGWRNKQQAGIIVDIMKLLHDGSCEKDAELELIDTYADITSKMTNLFTAYRNELGERWALALNHSEWDEIKSGDLESIRLADIFKKMNASDLKDYLEKTSEWEKLYFRVKAMSDSLDLFVMTDFLHKLPVVNCKLTYKDSNNDESYIGVSLQGNSFERVACSYTDCWDEEGIYKLFKECRWFDDMVFLRPGLSLMRRTKKDYKQYVTDKYSFVYQDIGIEDDTFEYLASLVITNMRVAVGLLENGCMDEFFRLGGKGV